MQPQPPTLHGRCSRLVAAAFVGFALVAAACGGGEDATLVEVEPTATVVATPTEVPTATAAPTATATPVPDLPESAINGMPVDEDMSSRRILAVKIDNHANARPQSGIQRADMMVEIWVEGITRFLTVWQESDTEVLGPIRSMRPTDFAIQNAWSSTFVNSGGQGWVQAIGNASTTRWFAEPRPGTFRISSRFAPHNLYGDTNILRTLDDRGDYEEPIEPLWNFGEMPADAADATDITTNWFSGYVVSWSWNGKDYDRFTYDVAHTYLDDDGAEQPVTADTLVMLEMEVFQAGGGSGSAVPESNTVGSGAAYVFAGGKMQTGTWARESDTEWFTLTGEDGTEMTVPPGRLWLVLATTGGVVPS